LDLPPLLVAPSLVMHFTTPICLCPFPCFVLVYEIKAKVKRRNKKKKEMIIKKKEDENKK